MRWKSHVRFGGRAGETHPAKAGQGAPVRPLHAMSVASFVAAQRTEHGVPHALSCRALEVRESWFYKWRDRPPTPRQERRAELDAAVKASFEDSGGTPGTYGSPRVCEDLRRGRLAGVEEDGGGVDGPPGSAGPLPETQAPLARPAPTRPPHRSRTWSSGTSRAEAINQRWCGDLTEIPTDEGKLYLATVEDLASRRLPGFAIGEHHDAAVAKAALCMAAAVRGGDVAGVDLPLRQGRRVRR